MVTSENQVMAQVLPNYYFSSSLSKPSQDVVLPCDAEDPKIKQLIEDLRESCGRTRMEMSKKRLVEAAKNLIEAQRKIDAEVESYVSEFSSEIEASIFSGSFFSFLCKIVFGY